MGDRAERFRTTNRVYAHAAFRRWTATHPPSYVDYARIDGVEIEARTRSELRSYRGDVRSVGRRHASEISGSDSGYATAKRMHAARFVR